MEKSNGLERVNVDSWCGWKSVDRDLLASSESSLSGYTPFS